MIDVAIDIRGELPKLRDGDMSTVSKHIADIMLDGVRRQFGEGGNPQKWDALNHGKGGPSFLFRSGALLQSIEATTGKDGEVFWSRVSTTGGLPYAWIHQEGGYAGRNHSAHIPARPYMVLTEEDQAKILEEATTMLVTFLNAKGEKIRWR